MLSPAKLNLFLAVTGRRADGFHDLVSVVAQVDWGDELTAERRDGGPSSLTCDVPEVPTGDDNLILRAAQAAGAADGWKFNLTKRVPMGAGLGGGSSNAAATLKLIGAPSAAEIAATLGSDCPLFLRSQPIVMRGRGERVSALPASAMARIEGRRVVIFKPPFGIATPWAYKQLAAGAPASYLPPEKAEAQLGAWLDDASRPLEELLYNNLEGPAFSKYPALPALLDAVRRRHGVAARMTGSGSACFALLPKADHALESGIVQSAREAWGSQTFCVACTLSA
ncbi:MAG TPA: 4-(cytidine 5'-diphospho)-2-C-methyl-D-erythritol kinase [Opitutaceae bacterium]